MLNNGMRPIHPGEVLREDFQKEMGFSAAALARALGVATPTVNNILRERGGISADMALRLSICLNTTPEFWLNLQTAFDLFFVKQKTAYEIIESVQRLVA